MVDEAGTTKDLYIYDQPRKYVFLLLLVGLSLSKIFANDIMRNYKRRKETEGKGNLVSIQLGRKGGK